MLTTITRKTTTKNIIKHIFLFVVLIGFSFSTLNETNMSLNQKKEIILQKLESEGMNLFKSEEDFSCLIYNINKDEIKSLENFNNTFTFKLTNVIYVICKKINDTDYENTQIERINETFNVLIKKISEFPEDDNNNEFLNTAIFDFLKIYSTHKINKLIFLNLNQKIISKVYKIIQNLNIVNISMSNSPKKNPFTEYMRLFFSSLHTPYFFINLFRSVDLKNLFIYMTNEYTSFMNKNYKDIDIDNLRYFIKCIICFQKFESIDSHKTVYFEIMNCFLENAVKILNIESSYIQNNLNVEYLLKNLFIKSEFNFKNITSFNALINIFEKLVDVEICKNKEKTHSLCISTIYFYVEYIAKIPKDNIEKNSKFIRIFEKNINKFITSIESLEIDMKNSKFSRLSHENIQKILNPSKKIIENGNFNNQDLIDNIFNTLENYSMKMAIFEFSEIDFDENRIPTSSFLNIFIKKNPIKLKNKIIEIIIMKLKNLYIETSKKEKLSIENFFTIIDRNFFIKVLKIKYIDMSEIEYNSLFINFLDSYNNIIKSPNYNIKDVKFYIVLCFYIIYFSEKLCAYENLKNSILEKLINISLDDDLNEFIIPTYQETYPKIDVIKAFEKLFVVNIIDTVKESDIEILEEFYKENFEKFMMDIIDSFIILTDNSQQKCLKKRISDLTDYFIDFFDSFMDYIFMNDEPNRNRTEIRFKIFLHFSKKFKDYLESEEENQLDQEMHEE